MLRNAIIVIILMLFAIGIADARLPRVGDQVKIATSLGSYQAMVQFNGEITDIGDGLICLSCTGGDYPVALELGSPPFDVCIGVGSVVSLTWI